MAIATRRTERTHVNVRPGAPALDATVVDVRFVPIDSSLREDPAVAREVSTWVARGDSAYRAAGMDPTATVTKLTEALDGREATVRVRPGRLTTVIAEALRAEVPGAEVGLIDRKSVV